MDYPLDRIKVIDFTQYQQGTVCTLMLADWGADVIKVEPRITGEPGRGGNPWGPEKVPVYFEAYNRNKKSITIDLKKDKGHSTGSVSDSHRLPCPESSGPAEIK